MSFHFIKYHDCQDQEEGFLKTLTGYVVQYCFSRTRYNDNSVPDIQRLFLEGRDKFFKPSDTNGHPNTSKTGELGEIALYFLLESYLKAPQIVSKMSLKTTGQKNIHGSDGIHFGIHNGKKCLFFCESKLDKDRSDAFRLCKKSVVEFYQSKRDFEISIIRNHIDIEDPKLRQAIIDFIDPTKEKKDDWLEINACFVGYDWNKFVEIECEKNNFKLHAKLKEYLSTEVNDIKKYLQERITFPEMPQRFYFFIIPFKDVTKLRETFLEMLYGNK